MPQLFDQLREFLSEVENEKQASVKKQAEANTEPSSQGGPTSHPSKSVDDNTQPATEGKRSQENASDVKKMVPTGGVDSSNDKPPSQEDQQLNVGITSTSTGNDPSNEDNYKDKKEDPGTTHPAKMEGGEKYSSMSFVELRKLAAEKANGILADVVKSAEAVEKKVAADLKGDQHKLDVNNNGKIEASDLAALRKDKDAKKEEPKEEPKEAPKMEEAKTAAAAGEAAATLTEEQKAELTKQAHEAVSAALEATINDGLEKAAMVGSYLKAFQKAAEGEGEAAAPEQESAPESEEAVEGGQGGMEVDPGLMAQMAGEEGGMGGAPASPDDAAQELLMALQEQGIDPAELLAMIQGGGAAPEAGMAPMGDKVASADAKVTADLVNLVKYAQQYRKAGKFKFTEAKTAQQRNLRDQIKMCVRDIIG